MENMQKSTQERTDELWDLFFEAMKKNRKQYDKNPEDFTKEFVKKYPDFMIRLAVMNHFLKPRIDCFKKQKA